VRDLLDHIVAEVPPPVGDPDAPTRAMIFDSVYDAYRGVITYVRVVDGVLSTRERGLMMSTGNVHEILEVGVISPEPKPTKGLGVGEVGYVIPGVKNVRQARVGDTVTNAGKRATVPLAGYRDPRPMVFSGPLSDGRVRLSGAARRAGQAAAQRRRPGLRAGDVGRSRVRLPLRLSRPAAHGDRP
jgi:GTP-binding protein LepA